MEFRVQLAIYRSYAVSLPHPSPSSHLPAEPLKRKISKDDSLSPLIVDGSEHFLAITLPSRRASGRVHVDEYTPLHVDLVQAPHVERLRIGVKRR